MYKVQGNNRFKKLEKRNFTDEKSQTQWWYFDFFLDDGSTMVLLFAPQQWWQNGASSESKSLLFVSYLDSNGELTQVLKLMNPDEVSYTENSIKCEYLEILQSHSKNERVYSLNFLMADFKGNVTLNSKMKAFSPLPAGSMGKFGTRHIIKKGKGNAYRYAAHTPQGMVKCDVEIGGKLRQLSGSSYHEQGWFSGDADDMGAGWVWYHFKSESVNIFGVKSFFFLNMGDEVIVGGLNSKDNKCEVSDLVYSETEKAQIIGGKISYHSKNLSFEISPSGGGTSMICLPSNSSNQLWGTALQESSIELNVHGKMLSEKGRLLLETCNMAK